MTYIIAEVGSNHNGCRLEARNLIRTASEAGVNAVKFQMFKAETLYSKNTKDFDKYSNVYSLIKSLETYDDFFKSCKNMCDEYEVDFLVSPFDERAVDFLVDLNVSSIKIASFEFTDARLVSYIANKGLPIIASTGLASHDDISFMLQLMKNCDVTLLHCNSAYPTPISDANLSSIPYLMKNFNVKCGYSDHTMSTTIPALAVALGASVVEKHITMNRNLNGPDHSFALEPNELKEMVINIREAEHAMGDGHQLMKHNRTISEQTMKYASRSIYASKALKKGDVVSEDNVTTKRPCAGIPAINYYKIMGATISGAIESDCALQWKDINNDLRD